MPERTRPHLLVDVTDHGYGHLAQTAPVLNALHRHLPQARITVRGSFPPALLAERIQGQVEHLPGSGDVGMLMASTVDVLVEESHGAYQRFHAHWAKRVEDEAAHLAGIAPTLILANIPYLTLAAASRAGIPALGMCSLNWADIYRHYCKDLPGAAQIHTEILAAYRAAEVFLRLEPGLPMTSLGDVWPTGPVANRGQLRRAEVDRRLGTRSGERLVLIALGGIDTPLPLKDWPKTPGLHWIVPDAWPTDRADHHPFAALAMPFADILRSVDVVVTKPGYGTFTEAACNGTPLLSATRPDWPETRYLRRWMQTHGAMIEVPRDRLWAGDLAEPIEILLAAPPPLPVEPTGVDEIARLLADRLQYPDQPFVLNR